MKRKLNLLITKLILSRKIRNRADRYWDRTLREFRKKRKKKPNRNELFSLVVKASHRTLGAKKAKGREGHIKRQWIRKYLLLKNKIRKDYKIQNPKR